LHHDDLLRMRLRIQPRTINVISNRNRNLSYLPRLFSESGGNSRMSIINAGKRMGELGFKYEVTCPECGKALNQDDAYGHDCEV
jgi:hypothetical protein